VAIRKQISPALVETYANMAGGIVTVLRNKGHDMAPDSVGVPVHGAEVQIVGEDDEILPVGEIGQVRHRGDGVAHGFVLADGGGNEKFQDGWLYPGDIGSLDENGFLYLHGRSTEIIKWAGMTVYAAEVERTLAEFSGVAEAAVVGAPSAEYGEEVTAFVVQDSPVRQNDLIAHCKRKLAPHKVPRRLYVTDSLPRNSAGKVVKARLLEQLG
jgi:acyl-CoA synthetase (AMP-forming)/AMP-acid ligase II